MKWGYLVIVPIVYLLLGLGPWVALSIVEWLLQRARDTLTDEEARLQALREGERVHSTLWPTAPRVGRYDQPDRMALEYLERVRGAVAEGDRILPVLGRYEPTRLGLLDALALRAWGPLLTALHTRQEARILRDALDQGGEALAQLEDLQQVVRDLPNQVRALLNQQRAEIVRLSALHETEVERGTKGLDDVDHEISDSHALIEATLDALSESSEAELPGVIVQADALIEASTSRVGALDQRLEQATLERTQAQNAVARVDGALQAIEERWGALRARGATEPAIARSLVGLRESYLALSGLARQQTIDAYRETTGQIGDLESKLEGLSADLDSLDDLMGRSKEAMEGNLKALADARAACDGLVRQDILLDPDRSLALIERSTQAYMEAERQRGLGTLQGYGGSLELAMQGRQMIEDSRKQAEVFPGQVQQVRELLAAMQPQSLGEVRSRAGRLREQLQVYARHWERGLNADIAEVVSLLDQAEVDLERLAPNVRYQRRFRQSETEEALDILGHVRSSLDRSGELIAKLGVEQERITNLRQELEAGLAALSERSIPSLQELGKGMLPDTKQRLEALVLRVTEQAEASKDPSRIDYDDTVSKVLPVLDDEAAQVRLQHERSVAEYDAMLRDTAKRLDRLWSRLARLEPEEGPGPEENIGQLSVDLDAWKAEVQREGGNLPALRDLLGPRASALEQRIENAEEQIVQGRRALESLQKDYRRHAQASRDMRLAVRELEQQSRWASLRWDWARAETAWQEAVRLGQVAEQASRLAEAGDATRKAAKAAEEAEDLFGRAERQISSALRHLDDELRAVNKALERAVRETAEARKEGDQEGASSLEKAQSDAQRLVRAAAGSSTFDEALRHLHDARQTIEDA